MLRKEIKEVSKQYESQIENNRIEYGTIAGDCTMFGINLSTQYPNPIKVYGALTYSNSAVEVSITDVDFKEVAELMNYIGKANSVQRMGISKHLSKFLERHKIFTDYPRTGTILNQDLGKMVELMFALYNYFGFDKHVLWDAQQLKSNICISHEIAKKKYPLLVHLIQFIDQAKRFFDPENKDMDYSLYRLGNESNLGFEQIDTKDKRAQLNLYKSKLGNIDFNTPPSPKKNHRKHTVSPVEVKVQSKKHQAAPADLPVVQKHRSANHHRRQSENSGALHEQQVADVRSANIVQVQQNEQLAPPTPKVPSVVSSSALKLMIQNMKSDDYQSGLNQILIYQFDDLINYSFDDFEQLIAYLLQGTTSDKISQIA